MSTLKNMLMLFVSFSLHASEKSEKNASSAASPAVAEVKQVNSASNKNVSATISSTASAAVVALDKVKLVPKKPGLKKEVTELTQKRNKWQAFLKTQKIPRAFSKKS